MPLCTWLQRHIMRRGCQHTRGNCNNAIKFLCNYSNCHLFISGSGFPLSKWKSSASPSSKNFLHCQFITLIFQTE
ncbi:hypothetical protein D917_04612 [Trichinella nativa]|uniref:Uncharacterized protein n=1 Tax=Trichinella nativa TaxID=6335 RepID=A0A1Y3E3W6_9BILA|nr:hypothetical protein D917_04612 [Trichinella nativa]